MEIKRGQKYRHYKHDINGTLNNYTYEIVGVGLHTEYEEEVVVYKPLYNSEYEMFVGLLTMFVK